MPIKKQNLHLYPHNWRKISWWIIHIRAQEHCEGILEDGTRCMAENHKPHPVTGKNVVLSVAHLDHDPTNSADESNMKAFCQRCHNRWDREHRNESIRETYKEKHGEVKAAAPVVVVPEIKQEELKVYESLIPEAMQEKVEQLKQTLHALLKEHISQAEAYEYNILLKSLELRDELVRLMNLPPDQLNTLQTQTAITIAKQKQGVIDQLIAVNKMTVNMNKIRTAPPIQKAADTANSTVNTATETPAEIEPEEPVNLRGYGIRHIIKERSNGTGLG